MIIRRNENIKFVCMYVFMYVFIYTLPFHTHRCLKEASNMSYINMIIQNKWSKEQKQEERAHKGRYKQENKGSHNYELKIKIGVSPSGHNDA